jgi:3'-phosphoadenosine 5'-phosphosulfate sulfotransferase (PAPS reductase)/FAD synthetase
MNLRVHHNERSIHDPGSQSNDPGNESRWKRDAMAFWHRHRLITIVDAILRRKQDITGLRQTEGQMKASIRIHSFDN